MPRRTTFAAMVCFLLAGAAVSTGKSISRPPLNLDHFLCYVPTQSGVFQTAVFLRDQFDEATNNSDTVRDLRIFRLCNPVIKILNNRATSILHPDAHLALFQMDPHLSTARRVSIRNQFGDQTLQVRQAETLAVPTGKTIGGDANHPPAIPNPTDLDHFKCYNATGKSMNRVVLLDDQFDDILIGGQTAAKVLAPIAFCNPVEKTKGLFSDAVVTPITNPVAHLACYAITQPPASWATALHHLVINNQFGFGVLDVKGADTLCVPSYKLNWSVIPLPREFE